jgi:acetyl esterase/lipase
LPPSAQKTGLHGGKGQATLDVMSIQRLLLLPLLYFSVKRQFQKNPDVFTLRGIMKRTVSLVRQPPEPMVLEHLKFGAVPVDRIAPPNAPEDSAILYLHGGGWVGGEPKNYWPPLWRLAKSAGVQAFCPDYRLAPEHPYPAGLDDAEACYHHLLGQGIAASRIIIAGDSAGGNLTLALTHRLKAKGAPMPGALICLSPATDFTTREGSIQTNANRDRLFTASLLDTPIAHYCPNQDLTNPELSPLLGNVSGFPPTLIHASLDEMLRDQSVWMADRLKAAGVPVEISVRPKLWHVWHAMADNLPEARSAIEDLGAFARARLSV